MQLVADSRFKGRKFESQLSHITFMETDHEIISVVILPLQLIQEGQLSVTSKSMSQAQVLVKYSEDKASPGKMRVN